jgi:hypothetical protein
LSVKVKLGRSLSTSISSRRQAATGAHAAEFHQQSSREISMAAICRSRFHSHFNCRRRRSFPESSFQWKQATA